MSSKIGARGSMVSNRFQHVFPEDQDSQYFDACRMQVASRLFWERRPTQSPRVVVMIDDMSNKIATTHGDKLRFGGSGQTSEVSELDRKVSASSVPATGWYF